MTFTPTGFPRRFLSFITLICVFFVLTQLQAEPEMRTWTSTVGTTLNARLTSVEGNSIVLLGEDGVERRLNLRMLSQADQWYVEETLRPKGQARIAGLDAEPGRISNAIQCQDDPRWSYHIYLPKSFHDGREWPVWFVFAPGGGSNGGALRRYLEGAELLNCILVLSVDSKNGFADSDLAILATVRDVNKRVPVARNLSFSSGFSGGGRMAYWLAEVDQNIAGVLACGTDHGIYIKLTNFRSANLRSTTFVYSLVGTNCFNRTGAFRSHEGFPAEYRLRFFPGNHDWAGASLIAEGMARVLGAGLQRINHPDANHMRRQYAHSMWAFTQTKIQSEPWEAHYWATYLKDFQGNRALQDEASQLARQLQSHPSVILFQQAERDLKRFGSSHFRIRWQDDREPNARRKSDADRYAETYSEIPYGEIFRRLGDKS